MLELQKLQKKREISSQLEVSLETKREKTAPLFSSMQKAKKEMQEAQEAFTLAMEIHEQLLNLYADVFPHSS